MSLQLTGTGGFCADGDHQAAEQETQRDAAVCAEPGSHIILSTPGGRPERSSEGRHRGRGCTATGDEPEETGHRASAAARTIAGSAGPRRGALSFTR